MSGMIKHGCLAAAGIAVAALAAGSAHAGKPMNVLQKQAAAEAMARQHQAQQANKGITAASAPATLAGEGGASVPDDLHNYLHARVDANGKVRILETDGPTAPVEEANHD